MCSEGRFHVKCAHQHKMKNFKGNRRSPVQQKEEAVCVCLSTGAASVCSTKGTWSYLCRHLLLLALFRSYRETTAMHNPIMWDVPQRVRDLELAPHLLSSKWQTADKPPCHWLRTCTLTIQSLAEALFSRRDLFPEHTHPSSSFKPLLFRAMKFLVFFASGDHANFLQNKIHFHESRMKRLWEDHHYTASFGRTVIGSHVQSPAVKPLPKSPRSWTFLCTVCKPLGYQIIRREGTTWMCVFLFFLFP